MPVIKAILFSFVLLLFHSIALQAQNARLDSLNKALAKSKADTNRVHILNELAEHWRSSNPDSAILIGKQAERLAKRINYPFGRIEALLIVSDIFHFEKRRQDSTLQFLEPARKLAQEIGARGQLAKTIYYFGKAYDALGNKDLAINYFQQALDVAIQIKDRDLQFDVLHFMAKTYMYSGRNAEAEPYYLQALELQKEKADKRKQARVLQSLGNNSAMANDLDQALAYYNRGIALSKESKDPAREADIIEMIAYTYMNKGYYPQALENYQASLKIRQALEERPRMAETLAGIGKVAEVMEDYAQALSYYEQALQEIETMNGPGHIKADMLNDLGRVYYLTGAYERALSYFFRALHLNQQTDTGPKEVNSFTMIGNTYEQLNALDSAVIYQNKALIISRKFLEIYLQIPSLVSLGRIYKKQGQTEQAVATLKEAVAISAGRGVRQEEMEARKLLYELFKAQDNVQQALHYIETFKALQDSLFNEKNTEQIVRLEAKNEFEQEKQKLQFEQERKNAKQRIFQGAILAALGIAILLIFLFAWYYRQKQRANVALRQINDQISIQNEQLAELDQLKSQFFTNISHELRTPLTIISGMASQIEQSPAKWLKKGTAMIRRNSANLLHLINQILDLRKLERGSMQINYIQGDIIFYLRYLLESFHSLAENKKIHLHFLSITDTLMMDFDREKIMQIFSNLISNAIKFTPEERNIYIQTEMVFPEDDQTPFLRIAVKDTGIGIAEDKLPHIFDRFYQIEGSRKGQSLKKSKGSGIGLSLVQELVHLLNGRIEVDSKLDKGTTFRIYLPISNEAPIKDNEKVATLTAASAAPKFKQSVEVPVATPVEGTKEKSRLLIVEDNPDVAQYLQSLLEEQYALQMAVDGEEGIDMALSVIPDLIISDVMMPFKNGYELCDILKKDETTSHIPIILLTSLGDETSRITGLEKGADAYLSKPFNPRELFIRLEKLLELRKRFRERYQHFKPLEPDANEVIRQEDAFIGKLRQIIEGRLDDEQFGIPQLCKTMGMSRSQLHLKIKALTNRSTSHYVRAVRLHKAKDLLQNAGLNVTEVAFEVGFKDPNYFSRTFTEEFGDAPSKFLKT